MTDPLHRLVAGDPMEENHGAGPGKLVFDDLWRRERMVEIGEVVGGNRRVTTPCGGGAGQRVSESERDKDEMTCLALQCCEELERIRVEQDAMMVRLSARVEQFLAHVAEQTVGNATFRSKHLATWSTMNGGSEHSGASGEMACTLEIQGATVQEKTVVPIGCQHVAEQRRTDDDRGNEEDYFGDFGIDKGGPGRLEMQVEMVQEATDANMGKLHRDGEGMDNLGGVGEGRVPDYDGDEMDSYGNCGTGVDENSVRNGDLLDKIGYVSMGAEMTVRAGNQGAVLRLPLGIHEEKMGGELTSLADALRIEEGEVLET